MNLTIGNNVSSILYNGNPVSELIFNGHSIWKSAPDYWNIPMTFEILTDGVISTTVNSTSLNWSATSKYKLNGGAEQNFVTGKGQTLTSISVHAGDKIEWTKFQNWYRQTSTSATVTYYSWITATCEFKVYGNLYLSNSEIDSRGFFYGVFRNCTNLKNVENLIIPYEYIQYTDSFTSMFSGCTSITKSPKIYIYNIKQSAAMSNMFYDCSNLSEVFCMTCNYSSSTINLSNWLYNVASSGKLICMPGTTWRSGGGGLPSNWTLEPYTPGIETLSDGKVYGHSTEGTVNFTAIQYKDNIARDTSATTNPVRQTLASSSSSLVISEAIIGIDKTNINSIPSNAKIRGVHGRIKYYVSNTNYVSDLKIQFATGSNNKLKGLPTTYRSTTTTNIYSINGGGDWTLNELKNINIILQATHNKSTSTGYVYIYGLEVYAIYEI